VLFVFFERPGLGIGHGWYVAIVLAAMAGGLVRGIVAGVAAAVLYALGVVFNPHVPPTDLPTLSTAIRLLTYALVGGMIGYFADVNRRLMGGALSLVDELSLLARRDSTTRLPNIRGFESAVTRRLDAREPFLLLVADVSGLPESDHAVAVEEHMQLLEQVGTDLARHAGRTAETARVGPAQFAMLLDAVPRDGARYVADELERAVANDSYRVTFGWALFPDDGETALSLYRTADERLYVRKFVRDRQFDSPGT
jgi:GGDEF domain-containing protein